MPKENQGRSSLFVGRRGSGKSWSSISVAEQLTDGKFDVEKHMAFFEAYPAIQLVKNAQPLDVVICDDMGVGLSAKAWYEQSNKLFSQIFQTCRTTNAWVIVTTPKPKFIDKDLRHEFDDYVIMQKELGDWKRGYAGGEWNVSKTNYYSEKNYWNRVKLAGVKYKTVQFPAPPKEKAELYDKKRNEAWQRLGARVDLAEAGLDKEITINQAANMLRLSPDEISNLSASGEITLSAEHKTLRVSMAWVHEVTTTLKLTPQSQVVIVDAHRVPAGKFESYPLKTKVLLKLR